MITHESSHQPHLSENPDADVIQYLAVSGLALVGLLIGISSPLAFLHPALWILPAAGIVINGLALGRIAREQSALVGRKAAVVGLVASVLTGSAAPVGWITYRWNLDREARQFAAAWFDLLAADEPHKAVQLTKQPYDRARLDDQLWDIYDEGSVDRDELRQFVSQPGVRALLALGPKATVRFYETQRQGKQSNDDYLSQAYAVTYEEEGQKKTFFVRLKMRRFRIVKTGRAAWQVVDVEGGIRPVADGGEPA